MLICTFSSYLSPYSNYIEFNAFLKVFKPCFTVVINSNYIEKIPWRLVELMGEWLWGDGEKIKNMQGTRFECIFTGKIITISPVD